jgi:predicted MFS family arabinose efflux permease
MNSNVEHVHAASATAAAGEPVTADFGAIELAPAGRMAWFSLWVLVAATLFAFVDRQVLALVAEPMARELELKDSQLGIVQGLGFAIFGLVATYPIGWLADRLDRRIVLAGCVSVWAAGTAACGMADTFVQLLVATLAIAAGEAGLVPIVYAAIPDMFHGRQRISANQIFYVATILGGSAGLFLGGAAVAALDSVHGQMPDALRDLAAWRLVFYLVAAPAPVIVLLIACTQLGRSHMPSQAHLLPALEQFGPYLRRHGRAVAWVFTALCAYGLPFGSLLAFTPVALTRLFGTSSADIGIGLGFAVAAGCLVGVALAAWAMRLFVPTLGNRAPLRISAWTLIVFLPAVVLLPFVANAWQAYVLIGLQMTAGTLIGSLLPSIIQGMAPAAVRGRVTALYSILSTVTAGLATSAVGPLSDALEGRPRGLLIAITAVSALSWIVGSLLMKLSERRFMRTLEAVGGERLR